MERPARKPPRTAEEWTGYLFYWAYRELELAYTAAMSDMHLSLQQIGMLQLLEEGVKTQAEMVRTLVLDKGAASREVRNLEAQGLVQRAVPEERYTMCGNVSHPIAPVKRKMKPRNTSIPKITDKPPKPRGIFFLPRIPAKLPYNESRPSSLSPFNSSQSVRTDIVRLPTACGGELPARSTAGGANQNHRRS